jgi:4-alpha-glucanotransferase
VEPGTREELASRRILSYRVVWFEKRPPSTYPELALTAVTTHDLPTIAGLWSGSDLEEQVRLQLAPNAAGTRAIRQRVGRMVNGTARTPVRTVIARLHAALAEAPSRILTATLEDAMAVKERPNMPATSRERPNWSLALPHPIEMLPAQPLPRRIARALRRRR